jgi:pimeloyl-ACP methyl ester carboxylesterase
MNKLLILVASLLTGSSMWLAGRAVSDLPQRVDVAGHQLRLRVEGTGSPSVIMEIGLGGMLEEWAAVEPNVARFTRVAAYDRIGSNHEQSMLTGEDIARELHAALHQSGVEPPYVLVGQSFGGIYNRIFASLYPDEVVGMVLLDPSQEDFIHWMEIHHPQETIKKSETINWPEAAGIWKTLDQLKLCAPLPAVPVTVVSATRFINDPKRIEVLPIWIKSHEDWVRTLPHGRHVLAPNSGHGVQIEAPELVVDLIREVVNKPRNRSASESRVTVTANRN